MTVDLASVSHIHALTRAGVVGFVLCGGKIRSVKRRQLADSCWAPLSSSTSNAFNVQSRRRHCRAGRPLAHSTTCVESNPHRPSLPLTSPQMQDRRQEPPMAATIAAARNRPTWRRQLQRHATARPGDEALEVEGGLLPNWPRVRF